MIYSITLIFATIALVNVLYILYMQAALVY